MFGKRGKKLPEVWIAVAVTPEGKRNLTSVDAVTKRQALKLAEEQLKRHNRGLFRLWRKGGMKIEKSKIWNRH